ncbi:Uncharacterised protein [Vibrio cholerae]|nr:Uncharacterised protein [Vibrio cholerae]
MGFTRTMLLTSFFSNGALTTLHSASQCPMTKA